MKAYLRRIDTDTPGNRNDVTPLFAHPEAFDALVDDLVSSIAGTPIDLVACIDALGFILGTAVARQLGVGVLPVRKGGKLPVPADRAWFRDYTGQEKSLEIRCDILKQGLRVLIVDEWIETGAQVSAAISLIERQGAVVAGIATIHIDDGARARRLRSRYKVWSAQAGGAS